MQTQVTCSVSPCDVTIHNAIPVLDLDEAGGAQIAVAVVAVWAIGWVFRTLVRVLKTTDGEPPESET